MQKGLAKKSFRPHLGRMSGHLCFTLFCLEVFCTTTACVSPLEFVCQAGSDMPGFPPETIAIHTNMMLSLLTLEKGTPRVLSLQAPFQLGVLQFEKIPARFSKTTETNSIGNSHRTHDRISQVLARPAGRRRPSITSCAARNYDTLSPPCVVFHDKSNSDDRP